ncbi:MAG: regulator of sirC expression with transglutaminase-like and TPR domain [Flavobacteriales bacterium]
METKKNITLLHSLINLVDDEDWDIFNQIRGKIIDFGIDAIPYLEEAWEIKGYGDEFQNRIEDIIHELQFTDVSTGIVNWVKNGSKDLLTGLLLVSKYQYPEIDVKKIRRQVKVYCNEFSKILDNRLSSHQKIAQLNNYVFEKLRFRGDNSNYYSPDNSIFSSVIFRKKGNPLLISLFYKLIANGNDINIVGINLPRHFIVGLKDKNKEILFYLSPFNRGSFLSEEEIQDYLNKLNLPFEETYFQECNNLDMIKRVLLNLMNSYKKAKKMEQLKDVSYLYELIKSVD